MKNIPFSKFWFPAVGAVLMFTTCLNASTLQEQQNFSLTSFDPTPVLLNPVYPASVTLRHTVTGSPTLYRVSRFKDFHDATWLPYKAAPVIQIQSSWLSAGASARENRHVGLCFQVGILNPKAKSNSPTTPAAKQILGGPAENTAPEVLMSNMKCAKIIEVFAG